MSTAGDDAVDRATRIVLRPLASPLPLGLVALSAGSLLVSGLQLKWFAPDEAEQVAIVLIAFVFPLQLLASLVGFAARDVVAGTAMGVLATTWLSTGAILLTSPSGARSDVLGTLLVVSAAGLLMAASVASASKLLVAAILATAAARLGVTGLFEILGGDALREIAGLIGCVLTAAGLYGALALLVEDARRRTLLPVGRRDVGAEALTGALPDQLEGLQHESGVRRQL